MKHSKTDRLATGSGGATSVAVDARPTGIGARRGEIRSMTPEGVDAEFLAALRTDRDEAPRHRRWVRRGAGSTKWLRAGVLVVAAFIAALMLNVGGPAERVGEAPTAQAADECNQFLAFICDPVATLAAPIFDGIQKWVDDAINPNRFCDRLEMTPDRPDSGFSGLLLTLTKAENGQGNQAAEGVFVQYNAQADTTWAKYGPAGTTWNTYFLDCLDTANFVNYAADLIFGIGKIISVIAILLFQQTFNSGLLNIFLGNDGGNGSQLDQILQQLNVDIYIELASLAIVIGALVLAWRGIIKGMGLADVLSKFLIMVLVSVFAALFVENASTWIKWGNEQTNETTQVVLSALLTKGCRDSEGVTKSNIEPVDCTAQSIYHALVYVPWANGEVGSLYDPKDLNTHPNTQEKLAYRILQQQALSWGEIDQYKDPEALAKHIEEDKLGDRNKMVKEDWAAKFKETEEHEEEPFEADTNDDQTAYPFADVTTNNDFVWQMFAGAKPSERFQIAIMALIASLTFGMLLIIIAITYLVLQVATVGVALAVPVAALIGLVPVYGLRVFLRVVEIFLGTFIKRLAMAVFIGGLLALYRVILDANGLPWWLQMVLLICLALGAMSYRKRVTSLSTLGFTGNNNQGMGMGQAQQRAAAARQAWRGSQGLNMAQRLRLASSAGMAAGGGSRFQISQQNNQFVNNAIQQRNEYLGQQGAIQNARTQRRSGFQGYAPEDRPAYSTNYQTNLSHSYSGYGYPEPPGAYPQPPYPPGAPQSSRGPYSPYDPGVAPTARGVAAPRGGPNPPPNNN